MQVALKSAEPDPARAGGERGMSLLALSVRGAGLELGRAAFMMPDRLVEPEPWVGHIPFAFWLMESHRPRVLVELGTHSGNSYCAFCQAATALQLSAEHHAIDHWVGDEQAGLYGEEVYRDLLEYHDRRYAAFSRLWRTTFDEAVERFADRSIDLLHIDGCHTYEALKHDFETWRPKLSDRSIVLFHDVGERSRDFGVYRLWEELALSQPSFTFLHHHGLGVLATGTAQTAAMTAFFDAGRDEAMTHAIRGAFWRLGKGVQDELLVRREAARRDEIEYRIASLVAERDRHAGEGARQAAQIQDLMEQIRILRDQLAPARDEVLSLNRAVQDLNAEQSRLLEQLQLRSVELRAAQEGKLSLERELQRRRQRHVELTRSWSWRATKPLRHVGDLLRPSLAKTKSLQPTRAQEAARHPASEEVQVPAGQETPELPPLLPPHFYVIHRTLEYTRPDPFRELPVDVVHKHSSLGICCLVHLYYIDLWDEISSLLRNLSTVRHSIVFNFVDTTVTDDILARASSEFPGSKSFVSPNQGRDAGGILRLASEVDLQQFDSVMVLHGKRSTTIPAEWGAAWRRTLMHPLIGTPTIVRLNATLMASDLGCGLIGSAACCSRFMGENRAMVDWLSDRMGIPSEFRTAPFVGGTMFMIRPELMREMVQATRDLSFTNCDSPEAATVFDGQIEHAIERVYGALVAGRGFRIAWRDTRVSEVDLGVEVAYK